MHHSSGRHDLRYNNEDHRVSRRLTNSLLAQRLCCDEGREVGGVTVPVVVAQQFDVPALVESPEGGSQSARHTTGNPAPTQELLTRHVRESFLNRLSRTEHAQDFIPVADDLDAGAIVVFTNESIRIRRLPVSN